MRLIRWIQRAWRQLADRWQYDLKVVEVTGNAPPNDLSNKQLARLSSGGQAWAAVMLCPCGCGDSIELMLLKAMDPHWELDIDRGLPTLRPSVWRRVGCRSHFWVKRGRIVWVN